MKKLFHIYLKALILLTVYTLSNVVFGQETNEYIPVSHSFQLQDILYNPSAYSDSKASLNANLHSYTGAFSDINTFYASGLIKANERRYLGVLFINEKTSDFFNRSRFYGIYQEHIQLEKEKWLRGGAQLGFVNYALSSLGGSTGGTDWALDFAIAATFHAHNFEGGFSLQQLPNSELTPILFTFRLASFAEYFAKYDYRLSPDVIMTPLLRVRHTKEEIAAYPSVQLDFYKKAGVTSTWHLNRGFSVLIYYKQLLEAEMNELTAFFSYFFPSNNGLRKIEAQQYELGISFNLARDN